MGGYGSWDHLAHLNVKSGRERGNMQERMAEGERLLREEEIRIKAAERANGTRRKVAEAYWNGHRFIERTMRVGERIRIIRQPSSGSTQPPQCIGQVGNIRALDYGGYRLTLDNTTYDVSDAEFYNEDLEQVSNAGDSE